MSATYVDLQYCRKVLTLALLVRTYQFLNMYVKSFPSVPKQGFVTVRITAQPWCFGRKPKATTVNHEKAILPITIAITLTVMLTNVSRW